MESFSRKEERKFRLSVATIENNRWLSFQAAYNTNLVIIGSVLK